MVVALHPRQPDIPVRALRADISDDIRFSPIELTGKYSICHRPRWTRQAIRQDGVCPNGCDEPLVRVTGGRSGISGASRVGPCRGRPSCATGGRIPRRGQSGPHRADFGRPAADRSPIRRSCSARLSLEPYLPKYVSRPLGTTTVWPLGLCRRQDRTRRIGSRVGESLDMCNLRFSPNPVVYRISGKPKAALPTAGRYPNSRIRRDLR